MGRKRHTTEEVVSKLRHVDVLTVQGHAVNTPMSSAPSNVPQGGARHRDTAEIHRQCRSWVISGRVGSAAILAMSVIAPKAEVNSDHKRLRYVLM